VLRDAWATGYKTGVKIKMYQILPTDIPEKTVELPASKSVSHRICILGGLNLGQTHIQNLLEAEDIEITLAALSSMGMVSERANGDIVCQSPIGGVQQDKIYLGNSGSSARFLLPLAAYLDKPVYFYGDPRLHQRPFSQLFEVMEQLGVRVECKNHSLPATIYPAEVPGGVITLEDLPTSQIITALMLSALWMKEDLIIQMHKNIPSMPYIKMTFKLMRQMGLGVEYRNNAIWIQARKPEVIWNFSVEKDLSAAAYWVVFGLINEAKIVLPGVKLPSLQGDERIFQIAEAVGAQVMLFQDRVEISGGIRRGFTADCLEVPDLVPTLSVLALFAPEAVRLMNVQHLRHKESDRIAAVQENIRTLGGESEYADGTLTICPGKNLTGGVIKTFHDHRIAMSFALAGSRFPGVKIDFPQCVNKSYPAFWEHFSYWKSQGRRAKSEE
jgi:3-phosphoshikimate 1-carboxyvinyltransferase